MTFRRKSGPDKTFRFFLLLASMALLPGSGIAAVTCYFSQSGTSSPINFPGYIAGDPYYGDQAYGAIGQFFMPTDAGGCPGNCTINMIRLQSLTRTGDPEATTLGIWNAYLSSGTYVPIGSALGKTVIDVAPPPGPAAYRLDEPVTMTENTWYVLQFQIGFPDVRDQQPPDYWSVARDAPLPDGQGRMIYHTDATPVWKLFADDKSYLLFDLCFDSEAQATVASDTGQGDVTLIAGAGTVQSLTALSVSDLPSAAQADPPDFVFEYGLFDLTVTGLETGGTTTLSFSFPENLPYGTVWWYWDEQAAAWAFLENLDDDGDNVMVIEKTDGGVGDNDNVGGQITDPGGPARFGKLSGQVSYAGAASGEIYVGIYAEACGSGAKAAARRILSEPGHYELSQPFETGPYYVCAFLDSNDSGDTPDGEDPQGGYAGNPMMLTGMQDLQSIDIDIEDAGGGMEPVEPGSPATMPVPALDTWGAVLMILALLGVATAAIFIRRPRQR